MNFINTLALFVATAVAEIVGCYLPWLWLREGRSAWLLVPAAFSLALFAWLLSLHPAAAGRVYAAYGGVYVGSEARATPEHPDLRRPDGINGLARAFTTEDRQVRRCLIGGTTWSG